MSSLLQSGRIAAVLVAAFVLLAGCGSPGGGGEGPEGAESPTLTVTTTDNEAGANPQNPPANATETPPRVNGTATGAATAAALRGR